MSNFTFIYLSNIGPYKMYCNYLFFFLQDTVQHVSSPPIFPPERCDSHVSTLSSSMDICRICHCEGDTDAPLISPCVCSGSLQWVHQACLQKWIKSADTKSCELCKFEFIMTTKVKPFQQVRKQHIFFFTKLLCVKEQMLKMLHI